jgi:TolA-binding protein
VSVSRGRVEVRSGGGLAVLDPGDRWEQAPSPDALPAAVVAPVPPAAVRAPVAAVAHPPSARRGPGPSAASRESASANESALFDRAWSSLRAGNAAEAAASFAELERRAQGHAIEEDALYWRAVSVARTKDSTAAGLLFQEFLRRFSGSSRRGEASLALGWILLDAGNVNGAKQAFEQALSDPAGSVRDSAMEGLRRTPSGP